MSKKIVKELLLEGLDCANCASKIEAKVSSINAVDSASMNFVTKTLSIEVENKDLLDEVLEETRKIINKLEPHVIVSEKVINKQEKKTLILMGLDCANCANKIENAVKNLSGVKSANVDFVNKKLIVEISNKQEAVSIIEEAKKIIKKIEPDVNVVEETNNKGKFLKREFLLDGLGCANCADKMESGIKSLEGIKSASVDFVSKKLMLEFKDNADVNGIIEEI